MASGSDPIQEIAKVNFESVLEARRRVADEAAASSRWILATLVSINLALGAVVISADSFDASTKNSVAVLVGAGVIAAVLLGYLMILAATGILGQLNDLASDWLKGMVGGNLDWDALVRGEAGLLSKARPWRIAAHTLGWISLACFVGAGLVVVCAIK